MNSIKMKYELLKIRLLKFRLFYLPYKRLSAEQEENRITLMCFYYLKNMYKKFLNDMPIYKGSGEISNKVWWCWLQGEENAPDLNKACLKSLREHLKDKEIIVITEKNYRKYVDFPEYIIKKYNDGIISRTHFSDLLRLELLIKYGGTWIDSSVFCTGYNKNFFDEPLFVFQNWKRGSSGCVLSNWYISSEKNNPILITTRNLLHKYWSENNYLLNYYIFHLFFTIAIEKYPDLWKNVPRFSNIPPHILQFELDNQYSEKRWNQIKEMCTFHKLSQKRDFSNIDKECFFNKVINTN